MANAIVIGIVKSANEGSFMLDNGQWYGIHPAAGIQTPEFGDVVACHFWTKNQQKSDGSWRTYNNVRSLKVHRGDPKVLLTETSRDLEDFLQHFDFILEGQPIPAFADDEAPF